MNIRITKGDKVARGHARLVSVTDHTRGSARGFSNISKEQQQKGGLKGGSQPIYLGNILYVNVSFKKMVRPRSFSLFYLSHMPKASLIET